MNVGEAEHPATEAVVRAARGEKTMRSTVFISHAPRDNTIARTVAHALESAGLPCTIAPENTGGDPDHAAVLAAIKDASVLVVLASYPMDHPPRIHDEVEWALSHNLSIVPFLVDTVAAPDPAHQSLTGQRRSPTTPAPLPADIDTLIEAVAALVALRHPPPIDTPSTDRKHRRTSPARVPAAVATFTGRTAERAQIARELRPSTVVTLVGPPGAGKSELARVAAASLDSRVVYVDLSVVTTASSLTSIIAASCGLHPTAGWRDLLAAIDDAATTLLLDNAETALIANGPGFRRIVRNLVDQCPDLRVLATSRERLGLHGIETAIPVTALPDSEAQRLLDTLSAGPTMRATESDAQTMARIRSLAEGLPLALVIIAAWLGELTPSEFLESWPRSHHELSTLPGIDEPDRTSSLSVSVALSVDAVDEYTRHMLMVLSLLPRGATDELIEAIFGTREPSTRAVVVQKSLAEKSGPRLKMLAPIREFVRTRSDPDVLATVLHTTVSAHTRYLRELPASLYRAEPTRGR
jgi:energy-coupling factor transporter ATP-binding protein EcfA2